MAITARPPRELWLSCPDCSLEELSAVVVEYFNPVGLTLKIPLMLIDRLVLKNLLSFRDSTVELGQLNVLIGPNAVGKSNLIEAIGLLQAAPNGFANAILRGGGASQWICLGQPAISSVASIECRLNLFRGRHLGPVSYSLEFSADSSSLPVIVHERVERPDADPASDDVYLKREGSQADVVRAPRREMIHLPAAAESVLAQFKNPADPTPITEVGNHFGQIRIFREFRTGSQSGARYGVSTNAPKGSLADGGDNLALVCCMNSTFLTFTAASELTCNAFAIAFRMSRSASATAWHVRFSARKGSRRCCPQSECLTVRLSFSLFLRHFFTHRRLRSCALKNRRSDCTPMPCKWWPRL